jgi:predicted dehydrogenase
LRILIIGLGTIAKKHIETFELLNLEVQIFALRSNLKTSIHEGINNVHSLKNLDIKFDFAIVSNPTHLHYKYINELAKLGIPLFIEKPALHNLKNISTLLNNINSQQLFTYVACNLRFHPCITFIKNFLELSKCRINEINIYCGSYLPDWRPGKDFKNFYSVDKKMGGGVHLDLFHEIDYAIWLFGIPLKSSRKLRNVSSLNISAFDYANYILEYSDFTANIILNYYRIKSKRTIELILAEKVITIDLLNNVIMDENSNILFNVDNYDIKKTYVDQMSYFITCLKNGCKPMNSLDESIEILKVALQYGK